MARGSDTGSYPQTRKDLLRHRINTNLEIEEEPMVDDVENDSEITAPGFSLKEIEKLSDVDHEAPLEELKKQHRKAKKVYEETETVPEKLYSEKAKQEYKAKHKGYLRKQTEEIYEDYEGDFDIEDAIEALEEYLDDNPNDFDPERELYQEALSESRKLGFAIEDLEHDIEFYTKEEEKKKVIEEMLAKEAATPEGESLRQILLGLNPEEFSKIDQYLLDRSDRFSGGISKALANNGLGVLSVREDNGADVIAIHTKPENKNTGSLSRATYLDVAYFIIKDSKLLVRNDFTFEYKHSFTDRFRTLDDTSNALEKIPQLKKSLNEKVKALSQRDVQSLS